MRASSNKVQARRVVVGETQKTEREKEDTVINKHRGSVRLFFLASIPSTFQSFPFTLVKKKTAAAAAVKEKRKIISAREREREREKSSEV